MSAQRRAIAATAAVLALAACASTSPPNNAGVAIPLQPAPSATSAPPRPPPLIAPASAKPVEGPAPPPKQPIDPKFKVDGSGLLLGVSATEIWLNLSEGYSVVIDRATGCAVEGYHVPAAFKPLADSTDDAVSEMELAKPATLAAIRDLVGLGRRFDVRTLRFGLDVAWSPDGHHIFVLSNELLYHSADGGYSFARVDERLSDRMEMSRDGKHLVYERCQKPDCPSCRKLYAARQNAAGCNAYREYVSLPTDRSRGPLPFTAGQTFLLDMTTSGRAQFWRSDSAICLDTFELSRPGRESAVCVPMPAKATGVWPSRVWESVSPSGRWGIVKWEEGRPNRVGAMALTYVLSLVDMTTTQIVKEVTDMRGEVDDEGNMVLQSMNEGGGDHTYLFPRSGARTLLGHHFLLAWRDKAAILGVHRVAPLGSRKCDLIKSVKTP